MNKQSRFSVVLRKKMLENAGQLEFVTFLFFVYLLESPLMRPA